MASVEFGILGPVEVRIAGQATDAGHSKQCAVLAVLLLDLGAAVSPELLIDRVWGEEPPPSVRNVLYSYVARLRAIIAIAAEPDIRLDRSAGGYLLRAKPEQLDLDRFRRLTGAATAGEDERGAALLREALSLWRGPALAGLDSPWLRAMRDTLELERTAALLDLNDVRLRLGQHTALLPELSAQAAASPADERLISQLMLALYRSGQQAQALARFEHTRQHLASEFGADPGPELRALHQRILRADPALTETAPGAPPPLVVIPEPGAATPAVVPRQLPAAAPDFTGRATELQNLTQILTDASPGAPGTVVISAIGGTAGVGKTTLALHWAHQIAHQFPDGQLYMNLRGFDPSGTPATAIEAIRDFLDALAMPPERVPRTPQAEMSLYRSLLSHKRMLIVLDNARDEAQVRPLLPASPASLVIVTSRNRLSGLAAADGARLLSLDVLSHDEAIQLLTARIGASRAAAETGAVAEIATLCAGLPLALAIAAARAATRARFPLSALAAELRDRAGRLDVLDADDPAAGVRAVFSWSYRQLSEESARMFRLLGLHPGPDISAPAAASLAGCQASEARRLLRELARDCLITEHAPGRYAFHDLLRVYAAAQANEYDSESDRIAASSRVLDHYLHTAAPAALLLESMREPIALQPMGPGVDPERLTDYQQALAWFEAERQSLLAAVAFADSSGFEVHAWQIPWTMADYLQRRGQWHEKVAIQSVALAAAERLGDATGQAVSHGLLGNAYAYAADFDQAAIHFGHCVELYRRLGNRVGEAKVQQGLAFIAERQGRFADALGHCEQSLRMVRAIDDKPGEVRMLNSVGQCHCRLGDYVRARAFCLEALALNAELGNRLYEGVICHSLGLAEHHQGNFGEAVAYYERSLNIARECGDRQYEAHTFGSLGDTHHACGEIPKARDNWGQALAILDDLGLAEADEVRAKLASVQED
jgi:DNA-binding SARP family transcriptional activator